MRVKIIGNKRITFNKGRVTISMQGNDGPIIGASSYKEANELYEKAYAVYLFVKGIIKEYKLNTHV